MEYTTGTFRRPGDNTAWRTLNSFRSASKIWTV
jgi:hypothetical protein